MCYQSFKIPSFVYPIRCMVLYVCVCVPGKTSEGCLNNFPLLKITSSSGTASGKLLNVGTKSPRNGCYGYGSGFVLLAETSVRYKFV